MAGDWKSRATPVTGSSWRDRATSVPHASPDDEAATSPVTAATTSLMNGLTGSWAPAIGAAGKTAMDAITGVSGPLGGGDLDELIDEYRNQRDALKASFAKAAAAHPAIATAGNVLGAGASLGLAGPAAQTTEGLATTGAVMGLGGSNADLTKSIQDPEQLAQGVMDTAKGAAINLAGGKLIQKYAKAVSTEPTTVETPTAESPAAPELPPQAPAFKPTLNEPIKNLPRPGAPLFPPEAPSAALTTAAEAAGDTASQITREDVLQMIRDKIAAHGADAEAVSTSGKPAVSPANKIFDAAASGIGGWAGYHMAGPVGGAVGAAAGSALRTAAPNIADTLGMIVQKAPVLLGKYAAQLVAASAKGSIALAAQHQQLMQTDPAYRARIDQLTNQQDGK